MTKMSRGAGSGFAGNKNDENDKNKNPLSVKDRNGTGFTLIEILVVIAILGLLASIVLVALNQARGKARWAKMLTDYRQLATAMEQFYDKYGYYPCDVPPNQDPGTGPVQPLEENISCVTHGLVESGFLSKIISSPCQGWSYDWDNWTERVALPTGPTPSHIVRMTLRDAASNTKYYYCYKDTHGSLEYTCGGKTGDPAYTLGGVYVNDLVSRNAGGTLDCR